jgi:DNA mismatch repair ATPase MutS
MNIVIDTNIFISALIKDDLTRFLITHLRQNFLFPEFEFEEIKNHKKEILHKSGLSEREFDILFLRLMSYVKIVPSNISNVFKEKAKKLEIASEYALQQTAAHIYFSHCTKYKVRISNDSFPLFIEKMFSGKYPRLKEELNLNADNFSYIRAIVKESSS